MKLIDFFNNVYRPKRLRGRSPETSRLYLISLRHFDRTMGHEATLEDLTDDNLNRHCQRVRDEGKAAATVNKDLAQILTIWRFAHRQNLVPLWPEVLKEVEPERIPMAWMPDEMQTLLAHIARSGDHVGDIPAKLYWRCFVLLAIDTGERVSALRSTRWDWISGDWLSVPAEARKGKTRDRIYKLNQATLDVLALVKKHCDGAIVLPWPYHKSTFWRKYAKVLEGAGLPTGRKSGPHRLRKTHASAVHAAGHSAQAAMDHCDARTTRAYLDPRMSTEVSPAEILAAYLANPGTRAAAPATTKKATG